jgi:hypothetical protein
VERQGERPVALDHRLRPERVTAPLAAAGFTVEAGLVRAPDSSEKVPQAHILARKADSTAS